MHLLNVEKANQQAVESLLTENGLAFEVYDEPETYRVISLDGVVSEALYDSLEPLVNESGTIWEWSKIYDKEGKS